MGGGSGSAPPSAALFGMRGTSEGGFREKLEKIYAKPKCRCAHCGNPRDKGVEKCPGCGSREIDDEKDS